ncbi:MAG: 16S rRNA (cytidine(1402)-2'-O)-methyltransferase [Patescibacteria group bacterium]
MLYIVATPIGNLEDVTFRALEVLKSVDFVLCEDTRVTKNLLSHYNINKPTISYHQHSKLYKMAEIKDLLVQGKNLALVSDAGTPGISDPGGLLIEYLKESLPEMKIIPIPGASAVASALSISGFPTDKFLFLGFPPHKKGRQKYWEEIKGSSHTVVFYESKYRILKSLEELEKILGEREVVVCRELTKMFETIYRGEISEVILELKKTTPRGEYVVVVRQ